MLHTAHQFNTKIEIGRWFRQAIQKTTIRSSSGERKT